MLPKKLYCPYGQKSTEVNAKKNYPQNKSLHYGYNQPKIHVYCFNKDTELFYFMRIFEYLHGDVVTRAGEGPAVGGQAGGVGTGHSTPTWPVQIKLRAPQLLSFLQFNNKVQPRLRLKIVFLSRHVIFPELAGPCSPPWKNAPATEPWKLHDFLH